MSSQTSRPLLGVREHSCPSNVPPSPSMDDLPVHSRYLHGARRHQIIDMTPSPSPISP